MKIPVLGGALVGGGCASAAAAPVVPVASAAAVATASAAAASETPPGHTPVAVQDHSWILGGKPVKACFGVVLDDAIAT